MLSGEKVLLTGVTGTLGSMMARALAPHNEVWGMARFADPAAVAETRALGVVPLPVDLESPDLSAVPQDFTYLLHFAHTRRGADAFPEAVQINAVGPGLMMGHCRKVKAALIVSSTAVYTPPQDVWHRLGERDPIGGAFAPWGPTSPVSKVSLEATARLAAEAFGLPTTIARLNTTYGPGTGMKGGMPVADMETVMRGQPVRTFADPYPHSPIHYADMVDQLEAMLEAAITPALTVNWCGDEVVTQRQWCELAGTFAGVEPQIVVHPLPGAPDGNAGDATLRQSITGPCTRTFAAAYREIHNALTAAGAK